MIVIFGMSQNFIHGFSILLKFLITFEFNVYEDKVLKLKFKMRKKMVEKRIDEGGELSTNYM